ncbi:hypothetical protein Tdes44962_MAKER08861 [Teratosphaeria destructans]|uniref:Uncharacterized protein n=1 Tax=Teratosphaeria destructans TaxID=418781 RepID=A0A9W7SV51_9PEZI|nr:hypothetical protein Tdes44962_MAKER08861 [Teratosphaeria destructans]
MRRGPGVQQKKQSSGVANGGADEGKEEQHKTDYSSEKQMHAQGAQENSGALAVRGAIFYGDAVVRQVAR